MTRGELIEILAKDYPHLRKSDIAQIVKTIIFSLEEALTSGERVEIRNFGVFSTRIRPARRVRNPRTEEMTNIGPRRKVIFRCGKSLRKAVNSPSQP